MCDASASKLADNNENGLAAVQPGMETGRPWWLGDLITIIGIFGGAAMIVWQLSRQHNNELKIQKENYRERLRLQIYQEFSKDLTNANASTIEAGMYAFLIPTNIKNYIGQNNLGINPTPVKSRAIEFSNKNNAASDSIVKLIMLFEKYEIVSPELDIFKLAVNVASYDMQEAFQPLYSFLLQILPMDIVDAAGNPRVANVRVPTSKQISNLEDLVKAYKDAEDQLGCYLYDLNIELQKIFLSRLFKHKLRSRQPIDPNFKVVTTDPEEMQILREYFEEETAWGKNKNKVDREVRAAVASAGPGMQD